VSPEVDSHARINLSRILNELAHRGQKGVASVYDKDVSTVSKWKDTGEFDRIAMMLAVLGLKVAPATSFLVEEETYLAITHIAAKAMANPDAMKLLLLRS
jgi:hypothetical protein